MSPTDLLQGLAQRARVLLRSPGLLVFAAIALAIGVAAPTTMFTIANGAVRDLPVPEGERLAHVGARNPRIDSDVEWLRGYELQALMQQPRSFTGVAGYTYERYDAAAPGQRPERIRGAAVTPNLFRVLRVDPQLGRTFSAEEAHPGRPSVAIISHALWQARFGGAADVIGRTLRLETAPVTIVGVMPPEFMFPETEQLWTPLWLEPAPPLQESGRQYNTVARLRDGVTVQQATAEVAGIARRFALEQPAVAEGRTLLARSYREEMLGYEIPRILRASVALMLFVLLIATANVANLLLARGAARRRETAIRATLGASRRRIIGEHVAEAGLIALAGGLLGFAIARAGIAMFARALAHELPFWAKFHFELPVLWFGVACITLAAVVAGIVPGLKASGVDLNEALTDEARGSSSLQLGRTSRVLVIGQLALSCGLLVVAGLMIKGVVTVSRQRGYDPDRLLAAEFYLSGPRYPDAARTARFQRELLERAAALPGATSVALTSHTPGLGMAGRQIEIEGQRIEREQDRPGVRSAQLSPGYFTTLGSGLLRGRDFAWSDNASAERVAIVNQSFAQRFFPGQEVIGKRIRVFDFVYAPAWYTIVGLAPDVGILNEVGQKDDAVYLPFTQLPTRQTTVLVRAGAPPALSTALRAAVESLDPDLPLVALDRLDRVIASRMTTERVFSTLFASFGIASLLLAAVGLYALMAFSVTRRTRELGVRVALGAPPRQIAWVAVRSGCLQLAVGIVLGLVIAVLVAPSMGEALFGMSPRDPFVFSLVPLLLIMTGLIAALGPARRALGLPVVEALRDS